MEHALQLRHCPTPRLSSTTSFDRRHQFNLYHSLFADSGHYASLKGRFSGRKGSIASYTSSNISNSNSTELITGHQYNNNDPLSLTGPYHSFGVSSTSAAVFTSRATSAPVRRIEFIFNNMEKLNTNFNQRPQSSLTETADGHVRRKRATQLQHTFSLPESGVSSLHVTKSSGTSSQAETDLSLCVPLTPPLSLPTLMPLSAPDPDCYSKFNMTRTSTTVTRNVDIAIEADGDKYERRQSREDIIESDAAGQSPLYGQFDDEYAASNKNIKRPISAWRTESPNQRRHLSGYTRDEIERYQQGVINIIYGEQGPPTDGEGNIDKKAVFVLLYPRGMSRSSSKKPKHQGKVKLKSKKSSGTLWQAAKKMAVNVMVECFPCFGRWVRERRRHRRSKVAP